jgi:CheY-like chemotaxis protein
MTKKVIVAEDMESLRTMYSLYLGHIRGLEYDLCKNGEELLEKIKNTKYDLVLTDNNMGYGINGIGVVKEIRKTNNSIPIYVISGDEIEPEALQAGATGYISKPEGIGKFFKQLSEGKIIADYK